MSKPLFALVIALACASAAPDSAEQARYRLRRHDLIRTDNTLVSRIEITAPKVEKMKVGIVGTSPLYLSVEPFPAK